MDKPKPGDKIRLAGNQVGDVFEIGEVYAVYDRIDVWWDTATGENKVALMDVLDEVGEEIANTAEWYVEVQNVEDPGETMALASFECEPVS